MLLLHHVTKHSKLHNRATAESEMLVAFYTTAHGSYHVASLYCTALFFFFEKCFCVVPSFLV